MQTNDNRTGWVFTQLIDAGGADINTAPSIWPPAVQTLVGTLKDEAGVPISGIQFAIVQGAGVTAPRNDAVTDDTGTFYAFMPPESSGTWTLSFTAVACTSNTMDANCNCIAGSCGRPDPESISIVLPRSQEQPLEFTWR